MPRWADDPVRRRYGWRWRTGQDEDSPLERILMAGGGVQGGWE